MHNEDMPDSQPVTRGEFKRGFARLSREIVATRASISALEDRFTSLLKLSHSEIMNRMDAFMSQTLKVQTDQTFLIHRMDNLEKRVSGLEDRAKS